MSRKKKIIIRVIILMLILSPFMHVQGVKMPPFLAVVVFENEPNIKYHYYAHNRVHQASVYRVTGKGLQKIYLDDELKSLKNYDLYKYWQY